jgi:hypothetical protein
MYFKYLRSLLKHKFFVFLAACKLGVPWLGIIHDLSKFNPAEFIPYAQYFYGKYPDESELKPHLVHLWAGVRTRQDISAAFDKAWLLHQKCNRHHWQFWVLIDDDTATPTALPMPRRYVLEMVADWIGAGRAYGNHNTLAWYAENRNHQIMHTETRAMVDDLLSWRG